MVQASERPGSGGGLPGACQQSCAVSGTASGSVAVLFVPLGLLGLSSASAAGVFVLKRPW